MRVGLFLGSGLILIMLAVILLGGGTSLFSRPIQYEARFTGVDGLFTGAKVVLGGLNVGRVDNVDLDPETGDIRAVLKVDPKYKDYIRSGTEAEILTQGVLGDKYVGLSIVSRENPVLQAGATIPRKPGGNDLSAVLGKSDQLMTSLNSVALTLDRVLKNFEAETTRGNLFRNLSQASEKLNREMDGLRLKKASQNLTSILEKVNSGTGTIGALINDPGLYDDARSLLGGANRNRIIRNLVRQTVRDGEEGVAEEQTGATSAPMRETPQPKKK